MASSPTPSVAPTRTGSSASTSRASCNAVTHLVGRQASVTHLAAQAASRAATFPASGPLGAILMPHAKVTHAEVACLLVFGADGEWRGRLQHGPVPQQPGLLRAAPVGAGAGVELLHLPRARRPGGVAERQAAALARQ